MNHHTAMPKIAWAKQLYNAYNSIEKNQKIFDFNGNMIGISTSYKFRCTATNPGGVQIDNGKWISGKVEKVKDGWKLTDECNIS